MKLKSLMVIGCLTALMVCPAAFAQNHYPKYDIFLGYSLMNVAEYDNLDAMKEALADEYMNEYGINVNLKKSRFLEKGFSVSFAYNFTPFIGLDTSFRYNNGYILSMSEKGKGFDYYYGEVYDYKYEEGLKKSRLALLVGPRITFRNAFSSVNPFVYGLVGLSHDKLLSAYDAKYTYSDGSETESDSEKLASHSTLGVALGGGIDISITDNVAIRAIQADYFMAKHPKDIGYSSDIENKRFDDISLSFGIVFRFGK